MQILDTPVLPPTSSIWVFNGSTIVETHSNNVVCHYQPIMLPDGNLRFVKSYASEAHDDVGVTYIWQRKITNNSLLAGAWILKPSQDPGLNLGVPYTGPSLLDNYPRTFYMLSDGNGLLTEFGSISNGGGNYQVDANGSWSMTIDPTTDPRVLNGYVNGLTGSWNVAGTALGGTIERVVNPALAQGNWSGSLIIRHNYETGVLATRTVDLSFTVDYSGKVTSLTGTGINGLRGGYMFVGPSGVAKVVLRTTNDRSSPLWEISLEGRLTGDTLYGLAVLDGIDSVNVPVSFGTVSRQTYNAPTFEQLVGTWNIIGGRTSGGEDKTLLPNTDGKFSNFTLAVEKTMTGTGYGEEGTGNVITNTTNVVWTLDYYWGLDGNMLRFGDPASVGNHYEIWRATTSPADPTIMNLECMIDSDDSSRTGEMMVVRKVNVVTAPVAVAGITLNKSTVSLPTYGKEALFAEISPVYATNKRIIWASSNTAVATVDGLTGMITGMSAGTATITATTVDGTKTATCVVTVISGTINNLSLLSGPWMLTTLDNRSLYLISNGAGLITDFGAISSYVGSYQTDTEGYFTMWIDPKSDDPMTINGRVIGNIGTWTIDADGISGRLERVLDPSLAQGVWNGSATVQYTDYNSGAITTASNYISFSVDAAGKVTSVTGTGITGLRGGSMFISPEGKAKVLIRTTNDRANPWWEFSLEGTFANDAITGRFLVDGASEEGVSPSSATFSRSTSAPVAVTGVTLNKNTTSLAMGAKETLVATIAPVNATNRSVVWSSTNTAVATVSSTGEVVAVSVGTATITVTTLDGSKTAVCAVSVAQSTTGKVITFDRVVSGLNIADTKIFVTRAASSTIDMLAFTASTQVNSGSNNLVLVKENVESDVSRAVLMYNGLAFDIVSDFSSLTFDTDLPAGVVVTVRNVAGEVLATGSNQ
jgi:uncharacterized protein YjdB